MESKNAGEFILFGGMAGGISSLLKLPIHYIFVWLKLAVPLYDKVNTFLIHGHTATPSFLDFAFAELGDVLIGSFFGIVLGLLLRTSQSKYHWWLGIGFGLSIWFVSLAFGNLAKIIKAEDTTDWSLFAHLLAMIAFGIFFVMISKLWPPLNERIKNTSWSRS